MSTFSFNNAAPSSFNSSNLFGSTSGIQQTTSGNPSFFGATSSATTPASPFGNTMSFGGKNFSLTAGTSAFNAPAKPFSGFSDSNVSNSSIFGAPSANAFGVPSYSNFGISGTLGTYSFGQPAVSGAGGSTSAFVNSAISLNQKGSRIASYDVTQEDGQNIISISAMKNYESKSQDELRFEDYQLGDKGQTCGSSSCVSGTSVFGVLGVSSPFKSTASNQSKVNQSFQFPCSSPFAMPSTGIFPLSNGNLTTTASNPFLRSSHPTISNTFAPKTTSLSSPSTGSKVASYAVTIEEKGSEKLVSISGMPIYADKSHEELRLEDYQSANKDGPGPGGKSASGVGVATSVSQVKSFEFSSAKPFAPLISASTTLLSASTSSTTSIFSPITNPWSSSTSSSSFIFSPVTNPWSSSTSSSTSIFSPATNPWSSSTSSSTSIFSPATNPWSSSTSSTWSSSTSSTTSIFSPATNPWSSSTSSTTSIFSPVTNPWSSSTSSSTSIFSPVINPWSSSTSSSTSIFSPTTNPWSSSTSSTTSIFSPVANPWSSSTSSSTSVFSPVTNPWSSSTSSTTSVFSPATNPWSLSTSSTLSLTPSIGLQNSSTSSLLSTGSLFCPSPPKMTPNVEASFTTVITSQPSTGASFSGIGQGVGHLGINVQQSYSPSIMALQPSPVILPSVTQPAVQVSVERPNLATSIQHGISSLPVSDKAAPLRRRSSLIIRHSSLSRHKLAPQKYNPTSDKPKVPFFMDKEDDSGIVRNEVVVIPRENPRGWVRPTTKEFPLRADSCRLSQLKHTSMDSIPDGDKIGATCGNPNLAAEEKHHDDSGLPKHSLQVSLGGIIEARMVSKHGKDVEAIMPKLEHADYYTIPPIQELLSKEKDEPGFCRHVKDFVVGRHGYGSIKFLGETDVRMLDLDSAVHFNCREVIIYMDENKKPPVGQGLNKPAEITLLNVRCINKSTGKECKEGPMVNKYRDMLVKKAADQDAEFVSYDPVKGEWTFKVSHF